MERIEIIQNDGPKQPMEPHRIDTFHPESIPQIFDEDVGAVQDRLLDAHIAQPFTAMTVLKLFLMVPAVGICGFVILYLLYRAARAYHKRRKFLHLS